MKITLSKIGLLEDESAFPSDIFKVYIVKLSTSVTIYDIDEILLELTTKATRDEINDLEACILMMMASIRKNNMMIINQQLETVVSQNQDNFDGLFNQSIPDELAIFSEEEIKKRRDKERSKAKSGKLYKLKKKK